MNLAATIAETWSTILGEAGSIPELQQLRENFAILSDSTRQLVKATTGQTAAQSGSAAAAATAAPSNARPSGRAYDLTDEFTRVGNLCGSNGNTVVDEQKRTNSLLQMSVDLLRFVRVLINRRRVESLESRPAGLSALDTTAASGYHQKVALEPA